ncbi:MAG: hypothetical protein H0T11_00960 [Chthoniobacterales bacterium]|nr:hypothetical protein [Chthoniobacterales bacterium]
MKRAQPEEDEAPASRVPRGGWLAITSILIGMTLISVYSNVQKARRDRIEIVTITPAASLTPTAAPSAR